MGNPSVSQDRREFVRVSVDLPMHPKLAELDDPAAGWLYVTALCYCGANLTDGEFTLTVVTRMAGVDREVGKRLVSADLWHEPGHECPKCVQPRDGHLIVHDYLRHNRSRAQADQVRSAGRTAAEARWTKRKATATIPAPQGEPSSESDAAPNANGMRSGYESHTDRMTNMDGMRIAYESDATPNAEVEEEEEPPNSPSVGGSGGDASQQAAPPPKAKRGRRLEPTWFPRPDTIAKLRSQYPNLSDEWWRKTHEKFVNHWVSKAGRDAAKLDWDRTFVNWVHNEAEKVPRGSYGGSRQATSTTDERVLSAASLKHMPTGEPQLAIGD